MNPDDAFERCLGSLYEAALDDARWPAASALSEEACGTGGNALTVGKAFGGEDRIYYARYLSRGECRQELAREYFEVHYPNDAGMHRLMHRPEGRPVHLPDLWTEDERCERTTLVFSSTPGRSSRAGVRGFGIEDGRPRFSPACS